MLWKLCWTLFFRPSPIVLHVWRVWLLKLFGGNVGRNNFIYPTAKIWAPWNLTTGDVATIGPGVEIYNPGGVILGHHAILSQGSFLCGATHDYNDPNFTYLAKPIVAEPYAWICARAIVLPGVICREGSVLGAGSVASRSLEAWSIYAGNPAVRIKERLREPLSMGAVGE